MEIGEQKEWYISGAVITHRGKVYGHNEDSCLLEKVFSGEGMEEPKSVSSRVEGIFIGAVSDGIGGSAAGEVASRMVVDSLFGYKGETPEDMVVHLESLNDSIHSRGISDGIAGMGATVAGVCIGRAGPFAFNVGDARVYRQQDDYLMQVSKDDSIAQVLVDAGELGPEETRSKNLHQITQALGGSSDKKGIDPHMYPLKIGKEASFLICSDGLHDMVSLDDIESITAESTTPQEKVTSLYEAALRGGGEDNISIIWIKVEAASLKRELSGKCLELKNKDGGKTAPLFFHDDQTLEFREKPYSYKVVGLEVFAGKGDVKIGFDSCKLSKGDKIVFRDGSGKVLKECAIVEIKSLADISR